MKLAPKIFLAAGLAGAAVAGVQLLSTQAIENRIRIQEMERRTAALDECLIHASTYKPREGAVLRDLCISVAVGGRDRFTSDINNPEAQDYE